MEITKNLFLSRFKTRKEFLSITTYSFFLLLFPVIIVNQLILGTIVNALLIKSSLSYSLKRIALLCFLPSISVLATGFLFGNLSAQLLLMIPFIWLGNFTITFVSRKLFVEKKKNYFTSTFLAGVGKTILLLTSTSILLFFILVPAIFLTMFGINQLITAVSGAIIVGFSLRIKWLQ